MKKDLLYRMRCVDELAGTPRRVGVYVQGRPFAPSIMSRAILQQRHSVLCVVSINAYIRRPHLIQASFRGGDHTAERIPVFEAYLLPGLNRGPVTIVGITPGMAPNMFASIKGLTPSVKRYLCCPL